MAKFSIKQIDLGVIVVKYFFTLKLIERDLFLVKQVYLNLIVVKLIYIVLNNGYIFN